MNSAAASEYPSQACRRQPQHSGRSAHSAAAAWFGFVKPKPKRVTSRQNMPHPT